MHIPKIILYYDIFYLFNKIKFYFDYLFNNKYFHICLYEHYINTK